MAVSAEGVMLVFRPVREVGRLIEKNSDTFPLLELLRRNWKVWNDPGLSHLDNEVFHGTQGCFSFLLIEVAAFYIKNRTESTALHAPTLY